MKIILSVAAAIALLGVPSFAAESEKQSLKERSGIAISDSVKGVVVTEEITEI